MITADPKSKLGYICRMVDEMKPGQCLAVDMHDLDDISSYEHKGAIFTPPDRVLGNIVGSGYTHSYEIEPMQRRVVFVRHEDTGVQRHADPDRRTPEWGWPPNAKRAGAAP